MPALKFHEVLADLIDACPLTQREIAAKLGYDKPNNITMFKQGLTKVPINKIGPLAWILEVDAVWLLRRALREYSPDLWEALEDALGPRVTANEVGILAALRVATDDRRQAETVEAAMSLSLEDRKRVQVALSALGHNTQGSDGAFGPRTRAMIASWQKQQGAAATGYLTAPQLVSLCQQAASALSQYDSEQRRLEEEKRRAAVDKPQRKDGKTTAVPPGNPVPQAGMWSGGLNCEGRILPISMHMTQGEGSSVKNGITVRVSVRGTRVSAHVLIEQSAGLDWNPHSAVRGDLLGQTDGRKLSATGRVGASSMFGGYTNMCTLSLSPQ